jgi:hypothetical protein
MPASRAERNWKIVEAATIFAKLAESQISVIMVVMKWSRRMVPGKLAWSWQLLADEAQDKWVHEKKEKLSTWIGLDSQKGARARPHHLSFMILHLPYVWLEFTTPKLRELISWDCALQISFFLFAWSPPVSVVVHATIGFVRSTSDAWVISSLKIYIGFEK